MRKVVVITASGSGVRMQNPIPKQFLIIKNKPVLFYTIEQFYKYSPEIEIIITLNKDFVEYWSDLITEYKFTIKHRIVIGGRTRYQSVKNAVNTVNENCLIAVHDAVRPFVSVDTIANCYEIAEKYGNAVPYTKITDSIRKIDNSENYTVDRENYVRIQTPQVFKSEILKNAYSLELGTIYTDDSSIVERLGEKINLVEGDIENFKITTAYDLKISELIV